MLGGTLGQAVEMGRESGNTLANEYQTWTYDDAGNRASDSTISGSWTYDNLNRMKSDPVNRYRNDILGNRQDRNYNQPTGGAIYEWDDLNRMIKTATTSGGAQYTYRADGMRIEKVEGLTLTWVQDNPKSGHYDQNWAQNLPTTRYFYDGQMAMEEDYTTGSEENPQVTATRYGIGARGIDYIDKTVDGNWQGCQFPIYDGHGNMIATIARNTSSPYYAVANQREYDVWGRVRAQSSVDSPNGPKMRYVANLGHPTDDESGLIYMRARYYEPWTGRFVSEDPAMEGLNWFIYCSSDPVNGVDRDGKSGYYDWETQYVLGVLFFFSAAIITMSRWGGVTVSRFEKFLVSALLVASAFHLSNAVGGTSFASNSFMNFLNHSIAYLGIIALLAEGLEMSNYVHVLGRAAIYACAIYSLLAIGLLIHGDIGD